MRTKTYAINIDIEEANWLRQSKSDLHEGNEEEATKQKIQPQGKPLKPWKDKEVPISEDEIAAAISQWDANPKLRHAKGILDAKQATANAVKGVLGTKAGSWVTIDDRPVFIGGPGAGAGGVGESSARLIADKYTNSKFFGYVGNEEYQRYLDDMDIESDAVELLAQLYYMHAGGKVMQHAADERLQRLWDANGEERKAMDAISALEESSAIKVQGDGTLMLYRRTAPNEKLQGIQSWTTSEKGANFSPITGGDMLLPNAALSLNDILAAHGKILYGFARQRGRSGEDEVLILFDSNKDN